MINRTAAPALLVVCLFLAGCWQAGGADRKIIGEVRCDDDAVAAAKVEVYLEAGRFRGTAPFAVSYTDENGIFEIGLPRGLYFLVARAEGPDGKRLFGEYSHNPVDLKGNKQKKDILIALEAADLSGEYRGPEDSGIGGAVSRGGKPAVGAYVYVYDSDEGGLMGPGYLTAEAVDENGEYRINLHPGRFWVAARLKRGGEKAGFVGPGDETAVYEGNPVEVGASRFINLDDIVLHPADAGKLAETASDRRRKNGPTGLSGIVRDSEGRPAGGLMVIVYDHPQMIGRPIMVGTADEKGLFSLPLPGGGQYYLGAREGHSGPRNPGEMAGGYSGTPDHSVSVEEGNWMSGLIIEVEEVW